MKYTSNPLVVFPQGYPSMELTQRLIDQNGQGNIWPFFVVLNSQDHTAVVSDAYFKKAHQALTLLNDTLVDSGVKPIGQLSLFGLNDRKITFTEAKLLLHQGHLTPNFMNVLPQGYLNEIDQGIKEYQEYQGAITSAQDAILDFEGMSQAYKGMQKEFRSKKHLFRQHEVAVPFVLKDAHRLSLQDPARTSTVCMIMVDEPYGEDANKWLTNTLPVALPGIVNQTGMDIFVSGFGIDYLTLQDYVLSYFPAVVAITFITVTCVVWGSFNSFMLALRSGVCNVMSIAFVFGLETLFYCNKPGSLDICWMVPLLTFTILIGTNMDYDVFLMTGVVEHRLKGLDTASCVIEGLALNGTVISAAGLIMAMAFCGLLFSPIVLLRQFGFIMVVGVLFDTFIMVPLIVPAVVTLLDEYNWDLCGGETLEEEPDDGLFFEVKDEPEPEKNGKKTKKKAPMMKKKKRFVFL